MTRLVDSKLYLVQVVSKALDILELLENERESLSHEVIYQRTRISKSTAYRILKTFVQRGYLAQSQDGLYHLVARPKKVRFGFGTQPSETPFSHEVTKSLQFAATAAGVDLMVLDNRNDAMTALENAEQFVQNRPDLVIELQIEQQVAFVIADKIERAGIPMIAVDVPLPHATFFGVDNYRVGFEAGVCLAQYAKKRWDGQVRWVLGLNVKEGGPLIQSRINGAFEGIRAELPNTPDVNFMKLEGGGTSDVSYRLILDFLRRHPNDRRILIATSTDTSALGAVQAVREVRREQEVAIVGQDGKSEALEEMRRPGSSLIASVSHQAWSYGSNLIFLGLALLSRKRVPPYNYVKHKLVTVEDVRDPELKL